MSDTTTTQTFPTIDLAQHGKEYRSSMVDGGLWVFTAMTPDSNAVITKGDWSPLQWLDEGFLTTATSVSIWNEAHNMHAGYQLEELRRKLAGDAPTHSDGSTNVEAREAQARAIAIMRAREERTLAEAAQLRARVDELTTALQRERSSDIDKDDPRVRHLWVTAAETARDEGFCPEYDRLARSMGIPDRNELLSRHWDVEVEVTMTYMVSVCVEAANYDEAIREADSMHSSDIMSALSDQGLEPSNLSYSEHDAKDATEVDD